MSSDEHLVAIVSFEGAIKRETRRLRERLKAADIGSEFRFQVEAAGRVQDGEVKLAFKLSGQYGEDEVKGAALGPVIDEYMRRKGWKKSNDPLAITFDEVPF